MKHDTLILVQVNTKRASETQALLQHNGSCTLNSHTRERVLDLQAQVQRPLLACTNRIQCVTLSPPPPPPLPPTPAPARPVNIIRVTLQQLGVVGARARWIFQVRSCLASFVFSVLLLWKNPNELASSYWQPLLFFSRLCLRHGYKKYKEGNNGERRRRVGGDPTAALAAAKRGHELQHPEPGHCYVRKLLFESDRDTTKPEV